jgi:vWA-MoxR associated protein C-terminal domain/vWA-MoxR associated protein middle region 0/Effector-associated domain 2
VIDREARRARRVLLGQMVEAFEKSATIKGSTGRRLWLEIANEELERPLQVRTQEIPDLELFEIVRAASEQTGGLDVIIDVLTTLERDTRISGRLLLLLDEWHALDFYPAADWSELRPALERLLLPGLAQMFSRATRGRQQMPAHCSTTWHAFMQLTGVNALAGEPPPCMAFLELVAERAEVDARLSDSIRTWNQAWAEKWNTPKPAVTTMPAAPGRADIAATARLVIQIDPDGVSEKHYTLSSWKQWGADSLGLEPGESHLVHEDQLPRAVELLLEEMETGWSGRGGEVILEFVLPWKLLNAPIEWWEKESSSGHPLPLAVAYPIIVRSLDRLRMPGWHRTWRTRWQQLTAQPLSSRTYWSRPAGDNYLQRLEAELWSDQSLVSLVLSEPPGQGDHFGQQELLVALRSGLPIAIWHREDCTSDAFRAAVAELIADGGLVNLPVRARQLKLDAMRVGSTRTDTSVIKHLAILWDDPDRQPQPPDSLEMFGGEHKGE